MICKITISQYKTPHHHHHHRNAPTTKRTYQSFRCFFLFHGGDFICTGFRYTFNSFPTSGCRNFSTTTTGHPFRFYRLNWTHGEVEEEYKNSIRLDNNSQPMCRMMVNYYFIRTRSISLTHHPSHPFRCLHGETSTFNKRSRPIIDFHQFFPSRSLVNCFCWWSGLSCLTVPRICWLPLSLAITLGGCSLSENCNAIEVYLVNHYPRAIKHFCELWVLEIIFLWHKSRIQTRQEGICDKQKLNWLV